MYEHKHIRINHECEGVIEKLVPSITDWHYEACRTVHEVFLISS